MTTRRTFIKSAAALVAGTAVLPISAFKINKSTPYGLILYTVRDDMTKDPLGTLEKVAAAGYEVVEAAGYSNGKLYGMKPSKFKRVVESLGMKLISSHTSITDKNVDQVVADASDAGLKYVIHPWMKGGELDVFKKMADNLNKYGEKFNEAGIRFGYHNHSFEFEEKEGVLPYDLLLKSTDPDLVMFEMDLFWITKGGHNPWEYFAKYPGRFEIWHVKDMKGTAEKEMTEVGNGVIDFSKIFHLKDQSGMKYYFVEEDTCRDYTPLESIKISIDYLKNKNF